MANLKDIAKSKGIEIKDRPPIISPPSQQQEPHVFQKRRAWISDDNEADLATDLSSKTEKARSTDVETIKEPLEKHTKTISQSLENHTESIRKPLDNNKETIKEPLEKHTKTISQSLENHTESIRKPSDNNKETISKPSPKPLGKAVEKHTESIRKPLDIDQLVGKEKILVSFIVSLCKKRASLETDSVSSNELKSVLDLDNNGLANIVFRVKDKKYINIIEHKLGRVSWRKFSIPQDLYQNFISKGLENHHETIRKALENHTESISNPSRKPLDKPLENHSSSMYVGINNTIHTETQNDDTIKDEWFELTEIDFSILAPWKISSSIIEQIKKNQWHLTRYQLEDFIERFVIYFTESDYAERSKDILRPYSFFLSSIKMISAGQPDSICDVKTKAEQSQELAMKNRIVRLEKEKKDRELLNDKAEALRHGEFEKWYEPLSENERTSLVPPVPAAPYGSTRYKAVALGYFSENIWPPIKSALIYGHTN